MTKFFDAALHILCKCKHRKHYSLLTSHWWPQLENSWFPACYTFL